MDSYMIWGIALITLIIVAMIAIYLVPEQKKSAKKKAAKVKPEELPKEQKDWKEACLKLEKHVQAAREQIGKLEKESAAKDKLILIEQAKLKKLDERLEQERVWHKKEEQDITKRKEEMQKLKTDLTHLQETYSHEHGQNIRMEKELAELRRLTADQEEIRRKLDTDNMRLNAEVEGLKVQVNDLRRKNQELSQEKKDTEWVAKTDYLQLEQQVKELKARLARSTEFRPRSAE
ncbi:MAG: hypothetical protein HQL26_08495 [Candidatus Omnitrophica bacterium]|nr:hypothetical protein [Candidatus Omnitrophota bacterium]